MRSCFLRCVIAITVSISLVGCITPSQQYSNTPQAACNRLGLYSGEQYNECLINMGTIDRAAEQQQRLQNCQNAKNAAGGGVSLAASSAHRMSIWPVIKESITMKRVQYSALLI